jgi:U4/U6.U5 tri-snRNP-associated protein 2
MKRKAGEVVETTTSTNKPRKVDGRVDGEIATVCPYLDTINRQVLDFDLEKCCSVTLSYTSVYSCLVCGTFLQGKSCSSPAYSHAIQTGHAVFLQLDFPNKIYCLPDNYEVVDESLRDIVSFLRPRLSRAEVNMLPKSTLLSKGVHGKAYLPGYVGLNNLKHTDYLNVMVQVLAHVDPLREFFLNEQEYSGNSDGMDSSTTANTHVLVKRLGELFRKMWNPRNFKASVDPREFVEAVSTCSKKRFEAGKVGGRTIDLFSWFLTTMQKKMSSPKFMKSPTQLINDTFQGVIEVSSQRLLGGETIQSMTQKSLPFYFLTVDVPASAGLYSNGKEGVLKQIELEDLLQKFNGKAISETITTAGNDLPAKDLTRIRSIYRVLKSPPYLLIKVQRFSKNNFFVEKKNTIVKFPLKNLKFHHKNYDLIASIVHTIPDGVQIGEDVTGGHDIGSYKVHLSHESADDTWVEIEDLLVTRILPQLVSLAETSLLLYKLVD